MGNRYSKFNSLKKAGERSLNPNVSAYAPSADSESDRKEERFLSTHQLSYGKGSRASREEIRKLHSSDAPVAMGRSGRRVERSLKTSGLPAAEDPALVYRKQGAPSSAVGGEVSGGSGALSFGRKSLVLFNPVAKVGVQIFADDPITSNC